MVLRWGILGCGDVARKRVARAIIDDPGSQLVAACRRHPDQLAQFCRDFEVPQSFISDDEMIGDEGIDAIYIATPVSYHCEQTVAAANQGKHVLVEKPMAMNVSECERMIEACERNQVALGVAYYRRFYPVIDRIKEIIAEGEIGEPRSVAAITCNAFQMSAEDDGYWRVIPEQGGGGALMDIGSHRLNLFLDLFGRVRDVQGFCDQLGNDYQADNTTTVSIRFENSCHGHLQCYFGVNTDPDEFTMIGTQGRLVVCPLNKGLLRIETRQGVREEAHPAAANFSTPLIADFVDAVRHGRPPRVAGAEGRATNEVMQSAYQSSTQPAGPG